jgi:hypothetical protein
MSGSPLPIRSNAIGVPSLDSAVATQANVAGDCTGSLSFTSIVDMLG